MREEVYHQHQEKRKFTFWEEVKMEIIGKRFICRIKRLKLEHKKLIKNNNNKINNIYNKC